MASVIEKQELPNAADLEDMHGAYCRGSLEHRMAPHAIYVEPGCPHPGCGKRLAGIDFRIEHQDKPAHDALLRAWWTDVGFAGRCPGCQRWVHCTIRGKCAISDEQAKHIPQLHENWADHAFFL